MSNTVKRDTARYVFSVMFVVVLGGAASLLGVVADTQEPLARFANDHSLAFAFALWIILLTLLSVVLYLIFRNASLESRLALIELEVEHLRKPSSLSEKHERFLRGMVLAANEIVTKIFDPSKPKFRLTRINEVTTVDPDGAALVERDYEIEGGDEPAQVWRANIFADQAAEEAGLLSDLDFKAFQIYPKDGQSLRYLLTEDAPRKKEVILFFMPPIQPGESRRFKLTYRWPRFAGDLIERGETLFYASYNSCCADDHAAITYEMRFAKEVGRLACDVVTVPDGGQLVSYESMQHRLWRYEHHDMHVRKARIEFRVKLVSDKSS